MARVLRARAPAPTALADAALRTTPASNTTLVVELGSARVAVLPGFDRATLAAVLEILATREGRR